MEWLYRRGLLFSNEFLAGEALALLIEWRLTGFGPQDSTVIFAEKFVRSSYPAPERMHLKDITIQKDGELVKFGLEHLAVADHIEDCKYNFSIWTRLLNLICYTNELERIERLFGDKRTLPMLATAVIDRVGVRDLPYTDVPRICSALYMLKEFWRERLLMALIDDAISCIKKEVGRPPLIPGQSRAACFHDRAA